jgi:4-amino-4-deoxy-L-arabinose transferase-like glycosyltransferase
VRAALHRPELVALVALSALLDLWALGRNGWANDYYSAAVRSMSSSWHNFLFASLDPSGVMTVDKPPLALWVQALSARIFGYHPLSLLVPQALMGVATVALVYDLVRRRFGRLGAFVGGLVLALTPITVAISRHNNPDALLVLCCVATLWFALRALEDGRTRWLVLAGVSVGLGFETKMLVALTVVPGIVAAWLWVAPRGRVCALRQLLAGAAALVLVGGAWPVLVTLTPAADRPWISGTSDNNILSLIFGYNGLGRLEGQSGGPGGIGGGAMFGGASGPLRLWNAALGGQAGWLLGFAIVCGLGILVASRLRRSDPRSGWLLAVGGAFLTTAVLFSAAQGIFHPYYVSLLAPFAAALVGAGAGQLRRGGASARIIGPLAVLAGVVGELAVLHAYPGQLTALRVPLAVVGGLAAVALVLFTAPRVRLAALGAALAVLLIAPASWALDTLGHATSGTFPAGGPTDVASLGGGPGGFGGGARAGLRGAGGPPGAGFNAARGPRAGANARQGFVGPGQSGSPSGPPIALRSGAGVHGGPPGAGGFGAGGPGGGIGAPFGNANTLTAVLAYTRSHGGGTVAVSSQSSASAAIIERHADVAGIGGFSGRESDVSVVWLAQEVRTGHIRWVLVEQRGGFGASAGRLPGDSRPGATAAMDAAARACRRVTAATTGGEASGSSTTNAGGTLYDCRGRANALLAR